MRLTRSSKPPTLLASSLDWAVSVHDDSQLELVFDYGLRPSSDREPSPPEASPRFGVDLFLVAPAALDLNQDTYPKSRFLADLTHRMRLHTPKLRKKIRKARLPAFDHYLALELDLGEKARWAGRVVQEVKLFANSVTHRLKRCFEGEELVSDPASRRRLRRTGKLLAAFRERYVAPVRARPLLFDEQVREAVLGVEEYLADRVESALSRASLAGADEVEKALAKTRADRAGEAVGSGADDAELERYSQRLSVLKKFVSEVLYLRLQPIQRERLYLNLIAASGAFLAATFAEVTRYQTTLAMGTANYGLQIAVLIGLCVVAYVFKDRIKDLSKDYLKRSMSKRLPERETAVWFDYFDRQAEPCQARLARHHEAVRHTHTESLPPDVAYVWSRLAPEQRQRPRCDVLRYTKQLEVDPAQVAALEFPEMQLKDVVRLDLSDFLSHLDNPRRELAIYDEHEGAVVLQASKVYYLDLVLRLTWFPAGGGEERVRLEAVRIVLDKRGLLRVDRPVPKGRYHCLEAAA